MKFSAVIAIVVIAMATSLAMVDATPVLDRRASQSSNKYNGVYYESSKHKVPNDLDAAELEEYFNDGGGKFARRAKARQRQFDKKIRVAEKREAAKKREAAEKREDAKKREAAEKLEAALKDDAKLARA
jgi:hypothetical protein